MKFNQVEKVKLDGLLEASLDPGMYWVYLEDHRNQISLNVEMARQLRDWLNAALPPETKNPSCGGA